MRQRIAVITGRDAAQQLETRRDEDDRFGLLHPLKQPARLQLSGVEQGLVCKRVRLRDAHGRVGDAKLFVQCLLQLLREGDTVGQQHEHLLGVLPAALLLRNAADDLGYDQLC